MQSSIKFTGTSEYTVVESNIVANRALPFRLRDAKCQSFTTTRIYLFLQT